jgi:hypothetical protein
MKQLFRPTHFYFNRGLPPGAIASKPFPFYFSRGRLLKQLPRSRCPFTLIEVASRSRLPFILIETSSRLEAVPILF